MSKTISQTYYNGPASTQNYGSSNNPYRYENNYSTHGGTEVRYINNDRQIGNARDADRETVTQTKTRQITRRGVNWEAVIERNNEEASREFKEAIGFDRTWGALKSLFSTRGLKTFPLSLVKAVITAPLRDLLELPTGLVAMVDEKVDAGSGTMMQGWQRLGEKLVNFMYGEDVTGDSGKMAEVTAAMVADQHADAMQRLMQDMIRARSQNLAANPNYQMWGQGQWQSGMGTNTFGVKSSIPMMPTMRYYG